MNSSLRDQLLAAGLVTEKQARQAAQQEQQRQFRDRARPPDPGAHRGGPHQGGGGKSSGGRQNTGGGQNKGAWQNGGTGQNAGAGQNSGAGHNAGAGQNTGAGQGKGQGQPHPAAAFKAQAQQAQAAKVARDQELNRRREDKAQRRARMAQIEQIIEQNRVPRLETEDYYSFIDGKKVRRMSVDVPRREQLTRGELVIVRYRGHYAVVPAPIAERIRERDANMVVPLVQPKASPEPEDAYKDFVIPDDLMW
jgi:uncharacterized protein YaiL (DUF2058 family)